MGSIYLICRGGGQEIDGNKTGTSLTFAIINCLFNPSMPHFRVKDLTGEGSIEGRGALEDDCRSQFPSRAPIILGHEKNVIRGERLGVWAQRRRTPEAGYWLKRI